ncbi:MlaD family protein [Dietzia lutea]|uniref:Mammalian cell entry protein n=1 Tax=Dietzia lutea TaxID=546160 RepID=A0A2S1R4C7_9ACTN|nr:MlaD family protein [Dietzia lutea]AWH91150.1 mammalian cell entry protein [Dietzia lutea]
MTTTRQAAIRLALVFLAVLAVIVLIVQAIQRPVDGSTTRYQAVFGDVFGLRENADVRLRGVPVGKITDISISDDYEAVVDLTLQDDYRLRESDRLLVKMQNLTGQRYLELELGDAGAAEIDPDQPVTNTVDSFDITTVFNGLKPLLRETDPAVYNSLATNVAALVEGSETSPTPVLRDIATLATYAEDRSLLMSTILDNLTALDSQLRGRSGNLQNMLEVFHSIFTPLVTRLGEFLQLVELGAVEFTQIGETVDLLSRIGLGATDRHDDFIRRTDESYADPAPVIEAYRRLPGILGGINALIPTSDPELQCSSGGVPVPIEAEVLLEGRQLVVCEEKP